MKHINILPVLKNVWILNHFRVKIFGKWILAYALLRYRHINRLTDDQYGVHSLQKKTTPWDGSCLDFKFMTLNDTG